MLLALATRSDLPAWEVDDRHLHAALQQRGVAFERPVWDDPAVDWARFAAVLIRTTWDYQDKLPAFLGWVRDASRRTRLLNPPDVVAWNTHKHYLRDLQRAGVPLAPTLWLDRGSTVDVAAALRGLGSSLRGLGPREGFLKPCVGATARETLRFAADADGLRAAAAHVARLLPHEDLMLQPFLPSVLDRGEWSAIFVDGAITHCVRKIPVPGDYRVQDDFGARDEPYAPTAVERAAAQRAMAAVEARFGGPLLYGRTDFLWSSDGTCVLTELELVEPSLFFRHAPAAADTLASAWLQRLGR